MPNSNSRHPTVITWKAILPVIPAILSLIPTLIKIFFGQMGTELHLHIWTLLITKLLRHHMTFGTNCRKTDSSFNGLTRTSFRDIQSTGNLILIDISVILSRIPTLIKNFFGKMGRGLHLNIGAELSI